MSHQRSLRRRGFVLGPALLALAGCGFHPLYASDGPGPGPAREGLGLISVAIIPERVGQLLRQALQARFDHGDAPPAKRFDLSVGFWINAEGIGIQQDSTVTRVRYVGQAGWTLTTRDMARSTVTAGQARAVDGLNTFDQQYFGQDIETETIFRLLADEIAEQITAQLATYFHQHPA